MKRVLLLLAFLLLPIYANAVVITVPAGTPLEPLFRAAVPGDEFVLADGRYAGGVYFSARPGPVTVRAENPGKAVIFGSTVTRPDCIGFSTSPNWTFDGLVCEGAAKTGIKVGSSDGTIIRNCTIHDCATQGIQTGTSDAGTIEDCVIYNIEAEHGIYVSVTKGKWTIRRNKVFRVGKAFCQINTQGAVGGTPAKECRVENNSAWMCGLKFQAGAVNLIGVQDSVIAGNTISDCLAGGISLSGNGAKLPNGAPDPIGFSTGNAIYNNVVTFRFGEGRACVTSSTGSNTVTSCRLWTGKSTVAPLSATNGAVLVSVGNVLLPSPDPVVVAPDAGTGGAIIAPTP